jgi:hypothetical protein
MDPDTNIETRTTAEPPRRRRTSRAPWDPPARPAKPSTLRRDSRHDEPAVLGGYYAELGRGVD